jgi:hypothetical protein
MTKFEQGRNRVQYMVCNYATTSITEYPVYALGKPASRCKTGENPNYPGLCSENEPIDPNNYNCDKDEEDAEKKKKKGKGKKNQESGEVFTDYIDL